MGWKLPKFLSGMFGGLSDAADSVPDQQPDQPFKRLILMRHGHELDAERMAKQVAHSLAEYERVFPDRPIDAVLHSPAERTRRTAELLHNGLEASSMAEGGRTPALKEESWLSDEDGLRVKDFEYVENIEHLDDALETVCLVTHSTLTPKIAEVLWAQADEMAIKYATGDHASMLVLDVPVQTWRKTGAVKPTVALAISQSETLRGEEIMPAVQAFIERGFTHS